MMLQSTSVKPSDTSMIPQRWQQRRRSPFCFHGFWKGNEETPSREMREARHLEKIYEEKGFLFSVWSQATGTGLHSQVPKQNRRNLSGLNGTQNRRSQTSVSVCRGVWIPVKPHVCFFHICAMKRSTYIFKLMFYLIIQAQNTGQFTIFHLWMKK